jgi:hypothetical protein
MKTKVCCFMALMSLFFLISCTKVQLLAEQEENNIASKKGSNSSCENIEFRAKSLLDQEYKYSNFTKTMDPLTARVRTIEAGVYSGGGINEWIKFNIVYNKRTISLVLTENNSDTAMHIKLNNDGFADYTYNGNKPDENFLPTKFKYKKGKVLSRGIRFNGKEFVANFSYDKNGNLLLMQDVPLYGELPGRSEYTYDVTRTVNNQSYFDEPRGFIENTYMLLQYMDLLPLKPVNIRTGSKVLWEDNYLVYDSKLSGHVIDGNGNLISYESSSVQSNTATSHYELNWRCESTKMKGDVE